MDFTDPDLSAVLDAWAASDDIRYRAEAHNIAFDERVDRRRLDQFQRSVKRPCAHPADLRHQLSEFVSTYCNVGAPHVPPTFLAMTGSALMREMGPEQKLVRLENITRRLWNRGLAFSDLEKSFSSANASGLAPVKDFMDRWNFVRDHRPTFAAFKDQLLPEVGDAGWHHKLRDRLGLADYSVSGGPTFVALMEYTVDDVLTEAATSPDIAYPFCMPTFLDSAPSPQFFPTPRELPCGSPMALFEIWSDDELIGEVLHSRLTYRLHHLKKLGESTSDAPATDLQVVRNNHLAALRVAAVRDDFGEEL